MYVCGVVFVFMCLFVSVYLCVFICLFLPVSSFCFCIRLMCPNHCGLCCVWPDRFPHFPLPQGSLDVPSAPESEEGREEMFRSLEGRRGGYNW